MRTPVTTWSVTALGDSADPRFTALREATQFWNGELEALGSRLRFGAVSVSVARLPESTLRELSEGVQDRRRLSRPRELSSIAGDVVVAFAQTALVSVGINPQRFGRGMVVLRSAIGPPLSLPNVARNVAAHELGHVLGLDHTADPSTLMCGRPATCRPAAFRSDSAIFFPLTAEERAFLARRWR